MRLFIAITLPSELIQNIQVQQQYFTSGKLSFTKPNQMHLTLLFLGEFSDRKIPLLLEKLQTVSFHTFALTTDKVGLLGNKEYLRVIYLSLQESAELNKLSSEIDLALKPFKIKRDFPFLAHITLARIKILVGKEKELLKKQIEFANKKIKDYSFSVNQVHLYASELKKTGPEYSLVKTFSAIP